MTLLDMCYLYPQRSDFIGQYHPAYMHFLQTPTGVTQQQLSKKRQEGDRSMSLKISPVEPQALSTLASVCSNMQ